MKFHTEIVSVVSRLKINNVEPSVQHNLVPERKVVQSKVGKYAYPSLRAL